MNMATADAIVVGAGVMGASIALELSRAGFTCVVVDRGRAPGDGSTSASSGIVRFNYPTPDGVALSWESSARWDAWEHHLGLVPDQGLATVDRCGMAFLDVPIFPRDRMVALLTQAGIPVEEWGPGDLRAAYPGIDAGRHYPPKPVHSEAFLAEPRGELGAVYTPGAGYVGDPRLAVANLAEAGARQGVRFLLGHKVTGLRQVGTDWRVTLDDGQVLEAAVVVNAAGPWSSSVNRLAGVGDDFTVEVRPLRQEVHHLVAPAALGERFPILADADLGIYVRPDAAGHLLVGGTEPECDPLEWLDDPDESDPRPTQPRFEEQVWRAARRFPELAVPNRARGLAGVYDAASDWTPVYDRTDADGFFVAMATSGNQFKNAPSVGSLMATLIQAVLAGHDHDADPVRFEATYTGGCVDLGAFSRKRARNTATSGTVFG